MLPALLCQSEPLMEMILSASDESSRAAQAAAECGLAWPGAPSAIAHLMAARGS